MHGSQFFSPATKLEQGPLPIARHRKSSGPERPGRGHREHKQAQLFAQVREAVEGALQTAHDPCLSRLSAVDVNQTGGSFIIVVQPREPEDAADLPEAWAALEAARSMLRREIATATSRKQTPTLQFIVLPAGIEPTD